MSKWTLLDKRLKQIVLDVLLYCGCAALLSALWTTLEVYFHGVAVETPEDTVMCGLFAALLWWVVRRWNKEVAEDG